MKKLYIVLLILAVLLLIAYRYFKGKKAKSEVKKLDDAPPGPIKDSGKSSSPSGPGPIQETPIDTTTVVKQLAPAPKIMGYEKVGEEGEFWVYRKTQMTMPGPSTRMVPKTYL